MVTKDRTVKLTDRGVSWFMSSAGVPNRARAPWKGRVGVVERVYRNKKFALVRWEGRKCGGEPIPVHFLVEVSDAEAV
jgi:hypothetical protein